MNIKKLLFSYLILFAVVSIANARVSAYSLSSPDRNTIVDIRVDNVITYGVSFKGKTVLLPSPLSLTLNDGKILGINNKVGKISRRSVDQKVTPPYGMAASYDDLYNEIRIGFKENYQVIFRVFNNGVAYRFVTSIPGEIRVKEEQINYCFGNDIDAWLQLTKSFNFSYEAEFLPSKISAIPAKSMAALPLVAESNGLKIAITEADLLDYPGYYFTYKGNNTIQNVNPKFILKDKVGGQSNFNKISTLDADYIAQTDGTNQFDLLKVNDGSVVTDGSTKLSGKLDMPFLFSYAKQKNVGIILWCVWHTLDRQMVVALDQFQTWGVKGVKVDFMNRDDQTVVNFYEQLAKEAAKRKMIVDFHAAFKPTGMERTYPNIINFEAVQGLEWSKFSNVDLLQQAVILPFTRMITGPMDYTPGGLYNANREDYKMSFYRPMTHGTRCNQLAA